MRLAVAQMVERYRDKTRGRRGIDLVEVVTGRQAIAQRFEQLQVIARSEVVGFDLPPYIVSIGGNELELARLAAGVHYRIV